VAAAVLPARVGRHYLFALLVGVFASLISILLTMVFYRVNRSVNVFYDAHVSFVLLPPLILSLIIGVILGKCALIPSAGLLAGLVVGISWFVSLLALFVNGGGIPYPSYWVTLIACAAACGLLCWLVAKQVRGTTEAPEVPLDRTGEQQLFTLQVGTLAGLFSVLLTGVIYSVYTTVNVFYDAHVSFALLPPLILSLITGFVVGKRVVVTTAGLVAGLLVGVFWLVYVLYMLVSNDFPPPAQFGSEEWIAVISCAVACGPLSWLVAWLTIRRHSDALSSGSR
jgi:hypothetical protein